MSLVLNRRGPFAVTVCGSLSWRLVCCALLVGLSACGGRWRTITTTADDDSADSGGALGVAGSSSARAGAAGVSAGRAGAGGTGAGGTGAAGAGAGCAQVPCPGIGCPSGSSAVIPAGQCCPVCQPVCLQVCAACGPGTQAQAHPGACCPDCVPATSCAAGQMVYEDARSTASYKFSFGCSSDFDCTVVSPVNACEFGCAAVALPTSSAESFSDYLKSESAQDCGACTPGPIPPCEAPPAAHCYSGQCAFYPP